MIARLHSWLPVLLLITIAGSLIPSVASSNPDSTLRLFQRPETVPFPNDNPYTSTKAALGKMLFFEPRLSRDRNLSCASCHNPSFGWEVPFKTAVGAGGTALTRHANTVVNLAWTSRLFWDGRADSLEAQARGPIEAEVEMDLPMSEAFKRLNEVKGYREAFDLAFPGEGLTETNILKAIATFERTIVTGETRFDRWVAGDNTALDAAERRGFAVFNGKGRCVACHSGWNFTDDDFHDIGLPTDDVGRNKVTGQARDTYSFKTPGLREIAARAPYMHNGSLATLEAVIVHYISGGVARPSRSPEMQPVPLNAQDISDLVAFLNTLTSNQATISMPNLPSH